MTCHGTCLFNDLGRRLRAISAALRQPRLKARWSSCGTVTNAGQPLKVARADVGAGWVKVVFWKDVGKGVTADSNQPTAPKPMIPAL